jgi:hypothetical protein
VPPRNILSRAKVVTYVSIGQRPHAQRSIESEQPERTLVERFHDQNGAIIIDGYETAVEGGIKMCRKQETVKTSSQSASAVQSAHGLMWLARRS